MWYYEAFAQASKSIAISWGLFNTAVLIGSSLTMALAVRSAQTSQRKATVNWLLATIVLGTVFLGVKVIEYADKFEHHHVPGPNFVWAAAHEAAPGAAHERRRPPAEGGHALTMGPDELQRTTQIFFSLYFTMTGLHALHMIVGIVILFIIAWMAHQGRFDSEWHAPVEMTGLYWHFVDIVWIFLFPLLYLVERHNLGVAMSSVHVSPLSTYLTIFAALMVFTAITVAVAFVNLGSFNPVVALGVAAIKATLVILYFMHVKYSSRLTKLAVVLSLFFVAILFAETLMDYATRGFLPPPPSLQ